MLAALMGLGGVLVGAVLTQLFAVSMEWRRRRLEAMVNVAVASSRVIGAHERLYELLFLGEKVPPVASDRANAALKERSDAHYAWRSARSTLEILIVEDAELYRVMQQFENCRVEATRWVLPYLQEGERYDYSKYSDLQRQTWEGMRAARHYLMVFSRIRSELDSHWGRHWARRKDRRRRLNSFRREPETERVYSEYPPNI